MPADLNILSNENKLYFLLFHSNLLHQTPTPSFTNDQVVTEASLISILFTHNCVKWALSESL